MVQKLTSKICLGHVMPHDTTLGVIFSAMGYWSKESLARRAQQASLSMPQDFPVQTRIASVQVFQWRMCMWRPPGTENAQGITAFLATPHQTARATAEGGASLSSMRLPRPRCQLVCVLLPGEWPLRLPEFPLDCRFTKQRMEKEGHPFGMFRDHVDTQVTLRPCLLSRL